MSALVTIMNLAFLLPDWNSLDSVRRAHSDLEAAGLVFFALLVIAEALAHNTKDEHRKHLFDTIGIWFFAIAILSEIAGYKYGERNDELSEKIIVSLDQTAKDADAKAQSALRASTAAGIAAAGAQGKAKSAGAKALAASTAAEVANRSAEEAENRVLVVKGYVDSMAASINPRMLNRDLFLRILAGKPKGTAEVWYEPDDDEAKIFAQQIADFLGPNGAGWDVPSSKVLPRKDLPDTYNEQTPLIDKLRKVASTEGGVAIGGGKPLDLSRPINEDMWTILGQAIASIDGVSPIHWGGMRFSNPASESHFTIVVGHHRVDVLRMTAPWQNSAPLPANDTKKKTK